jgi:hypothetical protein
MFWPVALIGLGVLLLLDNLGWLPGSVWGYLWPALLIFVGVGLVLGRARRAAPVEDSVSLDGAGSADITMSTAPASFSGAQPDNLLGTFTGGVHKHRRRRPDPRHPRRGPAAEQFIWPWVDGSARPSGPCALTPTPLGAAL